MSPQFGLIFSPELSVRRAHVDRRSFTSLILASSWAEKMSPFWIIPSTLNGCFRTAFWWGRRIQLPSKQQKQSHCFCVRAPRGRDRWIRTGFFLNRNAKMVWDRLAANTISSIFHRLKYGLRVSVPQREHGGEKRLNQTRTSRWPSGQENKPKTDNQRRPA